MLPDLTFVLGGAASGKSAFAETLIPRHGPTPVYIATAQAHDAEMQAKIDRHRDSRGPDWRTLEAPLDLPAALAVAGPAPVLIDCVTLWLSNHMLKGSDLADETAGLSAALTAAKGPVVIVSNEVGQGIVPDSALGRGFREAQGRLNIRLAARADLAVQVVAGLPNVLKGALS